MTLPANDVLPKHDELANRELSIEDLEAIAAGWPHWLKTVVHDVGNWIKSEVNDYVHVRVVAAGSLLSGTRDLLRDIF